MRARLLWTGVALTLLVACSRSVTSPVVESGPALPVRSGLVMAEKIPLLTEVPATVRPAERAVIAAKLTGTIASFSLGLGQPVHAGDVLLVLSAPETEARLHQAQAQLAEATRAAERERTLVEKGVNPPDNLRDAEDRLRFAQAAQAEAEALLGNATVRAPFDGVITGKNVLPGDLATPGLALLILESTQHLRAEGNVPGKLAAALHLGDVLAVNLDDTSPLVEGRIEELSAAADTVSHTSVVKVALPAGGVRSGQFVRLEVPAGETTALLVPSTAVTLFGQIERVFVIEDHRAVLRLVKTGRTQADRVELLSGVDAGERVVLTPPDALRDGAAVSELP